MIKSSFILHIQCVIALSCFYNITLGNYVNILFTIQDVTPIFLGVSFKFSKSFLNKLEIRQIFIYLTIEPGKKSGKPCIRRNRNQINKFLNNSNLGVFQVEGNS